LKGLVFVELLAMAQDAFVEDVLDGVERARLACGADLCHGLSKGRVTQFGAAKISRSDHRHGKATKADVNSRIESRA
jgi:hypothetical protein